MKKHLLIFIVLVVPRICLGNSVDSEKNSIFEYANDYADLIHSQLSIIENRMKQINPELVESVKFDTDEAKTVKYNNYLAEKTFNYYKDFFLYDLAEKSKESGREIMTDSIDVGMRWLNRGELDTDKCQTQYSPTKNTRYQYKKYLKDEREHICFYPNGFEEYSVNLRETSTIQTLKVHRDFLNEKESVFFEVSLSKVGTDENNANDILAGWIIRITYDVSDYDEKYAYLNQYAQDVKDGMYQYIPKKRQRQECNGIFCAVIEAKDMEKWKSSHMIPGSKATGVVLDNSISYQKSE